ncbi:DJ-1/PfpI family protein [Haloprofundus salilacus]|uniref:DJ-1/PfpI family protein n=1 Tax=Haloprofundus salilacus TaxID=2876190 RepID=UPI001CCBB7F9|nr:DJ-1/PfpI family protein [Haloprofundus salilacus]
MRVDIVLYDGFDELDAVGPYEVFSTAATFGAEFDVRLVTLDDRDSVTASHGLRVGVHGVLPEADADDRPDLVVVPGGGWNDRSEAGARAEAERGAIPEAVADLHGAGATVASVCTGGMLLATAGLTDGRPAVTHGGALDDLRESGAEVVDARFVDDGDLLTAGGVTSGIDLSLHLVEREAGAEIADRVATELEYERRETPYQG